MNDNVQVKFGGDTSDLDGDLGRLTSEFKQLFNSIETEVRQMSSVVQSEMREVTSAMKKAEGAGGGMATAFKGIKGNIAAAVAGFSLGAVVKGVVDTTVEFERLRAVLQTLEGDAAGARFEDLKKFATETPYDLAQVVTAFSKLKAQGLDPGNEALRAYGNIAAGMGKSLDQFVEAAADAVMGEMERLKEFGIKAQQHGDKITFIFKGTATTVAKNSTEIQNYLQSIGNKDFAGAMERQMKTLGGAFSNLGDAAASFADQIGSGGMSSALQDVIKDMTDASSSSGEFASMLGESLGNTITAVWEIVKGFGEVISAVFDAAGEIIRAFTGSTSSNGEIWKTIFRSVMVVINAFGVGVRVVMAFVSGIIRGVTSSFITFADIVQKVLTFDFSGALASFRKWGSDLVANVKNTAGTIVTAANEGRARHDKIWAGKPTAGPKVELPKYTAPKPIASPGKGGGGGGKGNAEAEAKRQLREQVEREISAIDMKMDAERSNITELMRLQDEKLAVYRRAYTEDSSEFRSALREKARMQRDFDQEMVKLTQELIDRRKQLDTISAESATEILQTQLEAQRAAIEDAAEQGKLNPRERQAALANVLEQELQMQEQHEAKLFEIKRQSIQSQLALQNLEPNERRRLNTELEIIAAEHEAKVAEQAARRKAQIDQFNRDTARTAREQWQQALQPIGQQFAGLINGMLTRTQTFQQGMIQIMDQLVSQMVSKFMEMVVNWIVGEQTKTAATQANAAIQTATIATTAATSTAATAASATTQVATQGAVGAAGAFASVASIPVIGPFIAPAIAAAAMAAILGFGRMISARGGADIGSGVNPMAQLHEEEMVLPAHIANPLRNMLAGPRQSNLAGMAARAGEEARANISSREGDKNFYYQPKHTNMGASMEQLLREDGRSMRKWLRNEMRNGSFQIK